MQKQITQLEEKLVDTPFGENLEIIKDLEVKSLAELLPNQLEKEFIQQIQQAQNYHQLVEIRNSYLAQHLNKKQSGETKEVQSLPEMNPLPLVKSNNTERYVWIGLLAVSLISISSLLIKLKSKKN